MLSLLFLPLLPLVLGVVEKAHRAVDEEDEDGRSIRGRNVLADGTPRGKRKRGIVADAMLSDCDEDTVLERLRASGRHPCCC